MPSTTFRGLLAYLGRAPQVTVTPPHHLRTLSLHLAQRNRNRCLCSYRNLSERRLLQYPHRKTIVQSADHMQVQPRVLKPCVTQCIEFDTKSMYYLHSCHIARASSVLHRASSSRAELNISDTQALLRHRSSRPIHPTPWTPPSTPTRHSRWVEQSLREPTNPSHLINCSCSKFFKQPHKLAPDTLTPAATKDLSK